MECKLNHLIPSYPCYHLNSLECSWKCLIPTHSYYSAYDQHLEGEFVLYKHKTLPYAVHTFQRECNGYPGATCNCAVAVRSGDDVIVVDRCGAEKTTEISDVLSFKAFVNGELTPGTEVTKLPGGSEFMVNEI